MVKLKKSLSVRPGLPVKCREISENVKMIRRVSGEDEDRGVMVVDGTMEEEGSVVETTDV